MGGAAVNQRMADWNGTVVHWIGAVQIRGARIEDLKSVLKDYGHYSSIYRPMIYQCRAQPAEPSTGAAYDVTFGLQNTYRAASVFPQHYSFQVKSRTKKKTRRKNKKKKRKKTKKITPKQIDKCCQI